MIRKFVDISLRYVIPGIATTSGIGAWIVASSISNASTDDFVALTPDNEYPPTTLVYEVPELPSLWDESSADLELLGVANCLQDSLRSARGLACDTGQEVLDPCYWPAGDGGIPYVFCFDPVRWAYDLYEVGELTEDATLWESTVSDYLIFVDPPLRDNLADYSDKLVTVGYGSYDLCIVDDFSVENPIDRTYTCLTGSTVKGGILGERPHFFVEYSDADTGVVSSQWLGLIVYG